MEVAIHPELYFEILRAMVSKFAKSDLPLLGYGQKMQFFYEKYNFLAIS